MKLKIRCEKNGGRINVYIEYNGCNPLLTMLLGDFETECELDSINFDVKREILKKDNTMYAVVSDDDLDGFIKEIYCFIIENRVAEKLREIDRVNWNF